jgi:hypothetical protein
VFERAKTFHALDRAATVIGTDPSTNLETVVAKRKNLVQEGNRTADVI